ncbi:MAG: hypothetical protein SH859_15805 [Hyphomicrobium aestuarii]|nr:hypothetical protein [Hyphomicrobium aestuarii]
MTRPTDETLMAYADGHLDAASRVAIERYLLGDAVAQRFVHTMMLVTAMTRHAFADQDFTRGMDPLVKLVERGPKRRRIGREPSTFHSAWVFGPAFAGTGLGGAAWVAGTATTAIALAWLAVAFTSPQRDAHSTAPGELSLGEVRHDSSLRAALDHGANLQAAAPSREFERYRVISEFKDKFGNTCRELDAFDDRNDDRLPAAVVVACRRSDQSWSVLGVIATRSSPTGTYAADAVQAHGAMTGVLEMLGANRRTSGIKSESEMR